ncbi:MAG TPA: hypothetical protein DEB62_15235 [Vibrio sp.]|uniref:Uncharacterized protein n=1 Tax=Vibrio casei TaxID=673372 RepID=A0A368LFK7_9VIBR|nr:hypothetical protein CIK83_17870 [Vibrio casei]HBV77706.1 hypothetical protein [Vibrio sp.]
MNHKSCPAQCTALHRITKSKRVLSTRFILEWLVAEVLTRELAETFIIKHTLLHVMDMLQHNIYMIVKDN